MASAVCTAAFVACRVRALLPSVPVCWHSLRPLLDAIPIYSPQWMLDCCYVCYWICGLLAANAFHGFPAAVASSGG